MSEYCLNLICPPAVEEKLLDVLLGSDDKIFTSVPVHSQGTTHRRLSAREQVMGRSQAMQIQILLSEEALARLLEQVQRDFAGSGIRYWASPVAFEGEIK